MLTNIYLCDDDKDEEVFFQEALNEIGLSARLTFSGNSTQLFNQLSRVKALLPDIIFLDLNMPGENGIEVLARIKTDPLFLKIPVIMYTTGSNPGNVKKTYVLGATRYFVKPNNFEWLKKHLFQILNQPLIKAPTISEYLIAYRNHL